MLDKKGRGLPSTIQRFYNRCPLIASCRLRYVNKIRQLSNFFSPEMQQCHELKFKKIGKKGIAILINHLKKKVVVAVVGVIFFQRFTILFSNMSSKDLHTISFTNKFKIKRGIWNILIVDIYFYKPSSFLLNTVKLDESYTMCNTYLCNTI